MATLSANSSRAYGFDEDPLYNDVPCVATDIVYEGAACGLSSGYARPLVAADVFLGFAALKADNSAGSAGAINVRVQQRGTVELSVVGVSAVTDYGDTVYASDDDTFTLTSTSNTAIGKIVRWISGTTCIVRFEAAAVQSL